MDWRRDQKLGGADPRCCVMPSSFVVRRKGSRSPPRSRGVPSHAAAPLRVLPELRAVPAAPLFVPTTGVALDVGFLLVLPACRVILVDSCGRCLLLRELGPGSALELRLLVCSPLEKAYVRVPSLYTAGPKVACSVLIPVVGVAFHVIVVLFGTAPNHFEVLVCSPASSCWEAAIGPVSRELVVRRDPSVVIGDVVYKLQGEEKYIMVVETVRLTLSAVPLPDVRTLLYAGNHWISKTAKARLCFFAIREPLDLLVWVLEAPGRWEQQAVDLRALMHRALVGDLISTKLSAKMSEQLRGLSS
ncbi:hypothetical protein BAE44_0015195 [Dichanthelium oligosanthes]|uniref:Uncharacterized protein n=1 Tax=Dichanthelium oligosanthes TaxID=888268 RepID=A0A1E5VF67_9POAL|nr:hypothetical protein BAE44_0015195 [Dichanthelium oligosanthes]